MLTTGRTESFDTDKESSTRCGQNQAAMRNLGSVWWVAAALLGLTACSNTNHPAAPANQQTPAPARTRPPTPLPTIGVRTPAPPPPAPSTASAVPSAAQTPTPKPSAPKLANKVPRLAADAPPQILGVAMSETTVTAGDTVSGSVVTTSNVASVQARIDGYALNLSKIGVGRFALTYTVGPLPPFVRGTFTLQVIARNTRGDTVTRAIPLTVR